MPYADKEQQRKYQRQWMERRRSEWVTEHGPCARCGSSDSLEVDHVDPATKLMEPAAIWSRKKSDRDVELAKCQVLCSPCHVAKTSAERLEGAIHGTATMRWTFGCICEECKAYVRRQKAESRARLKAARNTTG